MFDLISSLHLDRKSEATTSYVRMTNIERRIQLFTFVKKGAYHVRALGSLEAENIFGEFQDLDPKSRGVIRPDDIPSALSRAYELLQT